MIVLIILMDELAAQFALLRFFAKKFMYYNPKSKNPSWALRNIYIYIYMPKGGVTFYNYFKGWKQVVNWKFILSL